MGLRIVFQNSGGLDSMVAAKLLHDQGHELHSVFIDVGQPSRDRAIISAKHIADLYCKKHEVITMRSDLRDTFATSNMIKTPEELKRLPMRIPFGSTSTSLISSMVALDEGIDYIASGTRGSMRQGLTQKQHRENIRRMLNDPSKTEKGVSIIQPLDGLDFIGTVNKALEIGITKEELGTTVSCNLATPCGQCYKCKEREAHGIILN